MTPPNCLRDYGGHVEAVDPRRAGSCDRCGLPMPVGLKRDTVRESRFTRAAAQPHGIEGQALASLASFAERRAGTGPVRDIDVRDFEREVREELADARNYLVWGIEQLYRDDDKARTADLAADVQRHVEALGLVAAAWAALQRGS